MTLHHPTHAAAIALHPFHATLLAFPIACFSLTLLTDLAFWATSNLLWQHFSEWLLLAGLVFGVLAAIAGAIDMLLRWRRRASRPGWVYAPGAAIVLILAFLNSLVHAGDGWTAVVPYGLILSAVTVLVMLVTGWLGGATAYRHVPE